VSSREASAVVDHGALARAVALAVAIGPAGAFACGSPSSAAGAGPGDGGGGDTSVDGAGTQDGHDAAGDRDGPGGGSQDVAIDTADAGAGEGAADGQPYPDCPSSAQSSAPCTQAGAQCEVRCPVCGVTPGGQPAYTRDPIACSCQAVDPNNPARGSAWSCEAVDCVTNLCTDYVDPSCTTPVPCDGGVPLPPPPCGPAGASACAPGSYCNEPSHADPSSWTCMSVPEACVATPTCTCLAANGVGCACSDANGELIAVCGP
jgi:hypothetical protein